MRMPDARWLVPMILALVVIGCGEKAEKDEKPADQAAIGAQIDSVNTVWTGAVAAKDSNAIASLYAEDAHMLPANAKRVDGRDGIRSSWGGVFQMPGFDLKPVSNTKIVSEDGDLVVDLGTYEFRGTDPKGKPIHDTGKYVTVHKNVNGEWKIVVDTYNSDMPMAGMSK